MVGTSAWRARHYYSYYKVLICLPWLLKFGSHLEIDRIVVAIFRHSVVGKVVVELKNKILREAIIGRKPIVGH